MLLLHSGVLILMLASYIYVKNNDYIFLHEANNLAMQAEKYIPHHHHKESQILFELPHDGHGHMSPPPLIQKAQ
jgi:hypothetical protein